MFEEACQQVNRDDGHGTDEADPRHANSPRSDKESIVAVIGEECDKGAPKVQHVGCETGWVDTADQLQVLWEAKPKDKGGQS